MRPATVIGCVEAPDGTQDRLERARVGPPGARAPSTSPRPSPARSAPTRFAATRDDRAGPILALLVGLQRPDPGPTVPAGNSSHSSPDREAVAGQRAGDDRARSLDREDPVDEQARAGGLGRGAPRRASRRAPPAARRCPHPCGTRPGRSGASARAVPVGVLGDLGDGDAERLVVHQVAFRQRHDAARSAPARRGSPGAPRTEASTPRRPPPRTGPGAPVPRPPACSR